jgi:hypothetical protein
LITTKKKAASASMRKCAPNQGRPSGNVVAEGRGETPSRKSRAMTPSAAVMIRLAAYIKRVPRGDRRSAIAMGAKASSAATP